MAEGEPNARRKMALDCRASQHKLLEDVARAVTCQALDEGNHERLVFQILDSVGDCLIVLDELAREI